MAVDTAQKRFSMLNFGWVPGVMLFEADGAVDADDRSHLLHLYSGITLDAGTTGGPFPHYTRRRLSGGFIHHGLMMPCL